MGGLIKTCFLALQETPLYFKKNPSQFLNFFCWIILIYILDGRIAIHNLGKQDSHFN